LSLAFSERGGETNTQAALRLVHSTVFTSGHGDRQGAPNVVVIATDGRSNVRADRTVTEAMTARQRGAELFVVGVGNDVNTNEINDIASTPSGEHMAMMRSRPESFAAAATILDQLCV